MDQEMKQRILELHFQIGSRDQAGLHIRKKVEELFPEAFESDKPKPGEVWMSNFDRPYYFLDEDHFVDLIENKAYADSVGSAKRGNYRKIADSLEEYYRGETNEGSSFCLV